jgi:hypothetical protein
MELNFMRLQAVSVQKGENGYLGIFGRNLGVSGVKLSAYSQDFIF